MKIYLLILSICVFMHFSSTTKGNSAENILNLTTVALIAGATGAGSTALLEQHWHWVNNNILSPSRNKDMLCLLLAAHACSSLMLSPLCAALITTVCFPHHRELTQAALIMDMVAACAYTACRMYQSDGPRDGQHKGAGAAILATTVLVVKVIACQIIDKKILR